MSAELRESTGAEPATDMNREPAPPAIRCEANHDAARSTAWRFAAWLAPDFGLGLAFTAVASYLAPILRRRRPRAAKQ